MELITDRGVITIKNLTPHPVELLDAHGNRVAKLGGASSPPRVQEVLKGTEEIVINGKIPVDVRLVSNTGVFGLPEPKSQTFYIVSRLVAEYAQRPDLLVPDDYVHDETGEVIGFRGFKKIV